MAKANQKYQKARKAARKTVAVPYNNQNGLTLDLDLPISPVCLEYVVDDDDEYECMAEYVKQQNEFLFIFKTKASQRAFNRYLRHIVQKDELEKLVKDDLDIGNVLHQLFLIIYFF